MVSQIMTPKRRQGQIEGVGCNRRLVTFLSTAYHFDEMMIGILEIEEERCVVEHMCTNNVFEPHVEGIVLGSY